MYKKKNHIDSFDSFINEERDTVYNTNYTGMATAAVASLYTSMMAMAQEMAHDKAARDPYNNTGDVEEVDISRAINLIFHSNWKKNLKEKCLHGIQANTTERAGKRDDLSNKKNHKALAKLKADDNTIVIDKSTIRFSDDSIGTGPGSNQ